MMNPLFARPLLALLVTLAALAAAEPPAPSVAVARLVNHDPLLAEDWVGDAARDLLAAALTAQPDLVVLERVADAPLELEARLAALGDTGATDAMSGGGQRATYVLGGWFSIEENRLLTRLQLTRDGATEPIWSSSVEGELSGYAKLYRGLASQVVGSLLGGRAQVVAVNGEAAPPLAAAASFYRGQRALQEGAYAHATGDLLLAAGQAPDFPGVWTRLSLALQGAGRPAAAAAALQRALELEPDGPDSAETLLHLARSQSLAGDQLAALASYRRLIREHPFSSFTQAHPSGGSSTTVFADLARRDLTTQADLEILLAEAIDPAQQRLWADRHRMTTGSWSSAAGIGHAVVHGQALEIPLLEGNCDVILVAPDGSAIAGLDLQLSVADGTRPDLRPQLSLIHGDIARPHNTSQQRREVKIPLNGSGPWTTQVTLPSTGWNGACLRLEFHHRKGGQQQSQLRLIPQLRPMQPGVLHLAVEPVADLVEVHLEAATEPILVRPPCILRDLPPGPCRLVATVPLGQSGIDFTGESTLEIHPGDNEIRWQLPHSGKQALPPGWATPELVLPAARPGLDEGSGTMVCGLLPGGEAFASFARNGDLQLARRDPSGRWRHQPLPSPLNTTQDEMLAGAQVLPNGRVVLFWWRAQRLWASASDDLAYWSPPQLLLEPAYAGESLDLVGSVIDPQGRLRVFTRRRDRIVGRTSQQGLTWSPLTDVGIGLNPDLSLTSLVTGTPLVSGGSLRWLLRDRGLSELREVSPGVWNREASAPAAPPRRAPPRLWNTSAGVVAGETLQALWLRTADGGWETLPGTQLPSGKEAMEWTLLDLAARDVDGSLACLALIARHDGAILAVNSSAGNSSPRQAPVVERLGVEHTLPVIAVAEEHTVQTVANQPELTPEPPPDTEADPAPEQVPQADQSSGSGLSIILLLALLPLLGVGLFFLLRPREPKDQA